MARNGGKRTGLGIPPRGSQEPRTGAEDPGTVIGTKKPRRRPRDGQIGRPTLLTQEMTDRVAGMVRVGATIKSASEANGIARGTMFAWIARGRREYERMRAVESEGVKATTTERERPYLDFFDSLTRAEAEAEVFAAATLRSAQTATQFIRDGAGNLVEVPDWNVRERAATHTLERRFREGWSRGLIAQETIVADVEHRVTLTVEEQRARTILIAESAIETGALDIAAMGALPSGGDVGDGAPSD